MASIDSEMRVIFLSARHRHVRFGEWVRTERMSQKKTQHWLAGRLQVSAQYLSRVELGDHGPSRSIAMRLARILKVDEDETLVRAGLMPLDLLSFLERNPSWIQKLRRACDRIRHEEVL